MTIERVNDAFFVKTKIKRKEEVQVLLLSDIHYDSAKCDRKKLAAVFDEAVKRGAKILIFGDWLDVMQSVGDPRGSKSDLLPRYKVSNYFEAVVDDSVDFLKKYKDNLLFISEGNHETNIIRRHEINPLAMIAYMLKWDGCLGEYEGWIKFMFSRNSALYSKTMFYTHGSGGSSPVTRGVIQTNRRQVAIDADIYVSGHIHTQWAMPIPKRKLLQSGKEELHDTLHLQLGTFKESHKARSGWEAQRGFGPPSIGGYFLHFVEHTDRILVWEERTNK